MSNNNYYTEHLNALKLQKIYDTSLPRVIEYLESEINFVKKQLLPCHTVIELGAGYGRIVRALAPNCASIIGMDISLENITLGNQALSKYSNAILKRMDVHHIPSKYNQTADVLLCLQNGLSSMNINRSEQLRTLMNLLRLNGKMYLSTYSPSFWKDRLEWFHEQAENSLLQALDWGNCKNGIIRCIDGFESKSYSKNQLKSIAIELGYPYEIVEVNKSSLFLIIHKNSI